MTALNNLISESQSEPVAMSSASPMQTADARILTTHAHELPAELLRSTSFLQTGKVWQGTRPGGMFKKSNLLRRVLELRRAWQLFRQAPNFDVVMSIDNRNAGGVVAAIFKSAQTVQQNGRRLCPPHVSDNPAHISCSGGL